MRQDEAEKSKPAGFGDHSARYREMVGRVETRKRLRTPDGYGGKTGQCGDTIELFLIVRDQRIFAATFDADGCDNTIACANTVISLIQGQTIAKAWNISVEDVADYLETLPEAEIHCAELAVGALYLALSDYQRTKNHPWKRYYQK